MAVRRSCYALPVSRVARVSFHWSGLGQNGVTTTHWVLQPAHPADIVQADLDTVLTSLGDNLKTPFKNMLATDFTLNEITAVTEEALPSAIPVTSAYPVNLSGTRSHTDDRLPLGLSALVALKTNAAVRGGTGRFWAPPPIGSIALGGGHTWDHTQAYWLNVKAFCDALMRGATAGDWWALTSTRMELIVYSRTRRLRGDVNYYFGVSSYAIRDEPHWLRSREP